MTKQQHPITPPLELVQLWVNTLLPEGSIKAFAAAAQWGADQELEACCETLQSWGSCIVPDIRAARRPKPPSLKKQALADLHEIYTEQPFLAGDNRFNRIRCAIEALPND
jgi:hypothetical protein